ncbi:RNA polymerase II transcription factor B subunit 1 [Saitozyma podzolica]|uniref:RNA polymerase II transcription factor B subunit 1 n=1 Tax=Saitozyma podzolica TaxID=1890683 RepID=A0A427YCU6_9TREE|nr:RNA polymerase II transcription factor B subunit 1 [Saitozyma podzolica]
MSGEGSVRRYAAEFKKVAGMLSVTESTVAWVPNQSGAMDRQSQAMSRVINMFASKADAKKTQLKLAFRDDIPTGGLMFTFTSATKDDDRKAVQDALIPFVSANKAGGSGSASTPAAGAGPSTPLVGTPGGPSPAAASPAPVTPAQVGVGGAGVGAKGKRKADGSPSTGSVDASKAARPVNYKLRLRVLNKNPNLKMLHRELVLGKQITEEEFWEGREALLQAEEMAYSQRPGRASRLLDDRFDLDAGKKGSAGAGGTGVGIKTKQDTGPVVLNLSKDLTREIFEEFPVVQDAYARHVPGIREAEFWSRYFTSQLWERHRASVRKSANDEVTKKKDDIFDQYLEEPDWNPAPRKQMTDSVERFLDLAATEEDHGETDTVRDVTMQAGRERSSLPLIRRFNEHSNKLLRRGGDESKMKKTTLSHTILPEDYDIYNEIDLEDLHGPAAAQTIPLDVQDTDAVVNGDKETTSAKGVMPGRSAEDLLEIARNEVGRLQNLRVDFSEVSLANPLASGDREAVPSPEQVKQTERFAAQRDAQLAAMLVVKELHLASNAENAVNAPFPDAILEQMRSCHNAATEFLRQYWSAVLPTAAGALGAGTNATSAAVKAAKAEKMAGYLRSTDNKVNAVVHTATIAGFDPARVRAALAPTIGAVHVALEREKRRLANGAV